LSIGHEKGIAGTQEITLIAVPTSAHPYIHAATSIGKLTQP
jgi:hypothetical protein